MTDFESMSAEELKKLILETSEILKSATESYKQTEEKVTVVQEEMVPVYDKYIELKSEKNKLESAMKGMRPIIEENKNALMHLRHWLSRAEMRALEAKEYDKLSRELDEFAPSFPWFGRAFKHQIDGGKRLALVQGRGILGDKRGLGKTLTSLITCDFVKSRKIIVFAPKETIKNFEDEIKEWAPRRTLISLIGKNKITRDLTISTLKNIDEFILTMNLESWRRDEYLVPALIDTQVDTVIIDEAHFIKESKALTSQGVQRIVHAQNMCAMCGENSLVFDGHNMACSTFNCIGQGIKYKPHDPNCMSVKHIIPMTGTPILNSPVDMWLLLNLVDPVNFKHKIDFCNLYCERNYQGKWVFKKPRYANEKSGEEALLAKLGLSFIQRDRKTAGIEIPPQKIQFYDIEFDKEKYPRQYRAYRELKEKAMIFSDQFPDEVKTVDWAITFMLRARQMMAWPMSIVWKDPITNKILFQCDVDESIKLDKAVELAQELVQEGERVVVFSQFTGPLKELHNRLSDTEVETSTGTRKIKPALLYGATSESQRERIRYDFNAKNESNEYDIVLAHYRVGGQSLNFTAATQMIIIDEEWSPGKNEQAYGRIDRIGQTKETTVHVLQVANTIDTTMREIIEMKQDIIEGFEGKLDLADRLRRAIQDGEM